MKTRSPGNFLLSPFIPLTVDCGGGGSGNKQSQVVEMRLFRLVSCMILSICTHGIRTAQQWLSPGWPKT